MKSLMFAVFVFAAITLTLADTNKKEITAFTPLQVRWGCFVSRARGDGSLDLELGL